MKQAMRTMARVDSELETITERQREEEAMRGRSIAGGDIEQSQEIDESYSFSLRAGGNKNIFNNKGGSSQDLDAQLGTFKRGSNMSNYSH
jgi:hypothetical protein